MNYVNFFIAGFFVSEALGGVFRGEPWKASAALAALNLLPALLTLVMRVAKT